MKRTKYFELISELFKFKTITDEYGNEFVLFAQSHLNSIENIIDKTEFEASENHIHLIRNLKKSEFFRLIPTAKILGKILLVALENQYPDKHFIVFVSIKIHDSFIIRFHQKWDNEEDFCNPDDFHFGDELVFSFETGKENAKKSGDGFLS